MALPVEHRTETDRAPALVGHDAAAQYGNFQRGCDT